LSFDRQTRYVTSDPAELARQLAALENNVDRALRALELAARPWVQGVVDVIGAREVAPGYLYRCNTQAGAYTIVLATPTLADAGKPTVFWLTGAGALTVTSPALIGGATLVITSTTVSTLVNCDGTTYRREF
jgi:hypothetical protein